MIEFKLRENKKRLRFTHVSTEPTKEQIRLFYILNILDLATTIHGLKDPYVKESNPLLPDKPSVEELVLHKIILAPLIQQNFNSAQMDVVNGALGYAVIGNIIVIND